MKTTARFSSSVFTYPGAAAWHFATVPKKESTMIKGNTLRRIAWGSIKVRATVGNTSWETSIFPTKEGLYLLALKAAVRKKENIYSGDTIEIACTLI
jgi:hypothetical protein